MNPQHLIHRPHVLFGTLVLFIAMLIIGCQENANPVGPELDESSISEEAGPTAGAKPNCDVDPNHPKCDDGGGDDMTKVEAVGAIAWDPYDFVISSNDESSLELHADRPPNGSTTITEFTTQFELTHFYLSGGDYHVSETDITEAVANGDCGVDYGKGSSLAEAAALTDLVLGLSTSNSVQVASIWYDKTRDGLESEDHRMNTIYHETYGSTSVNIVLGVKNSPGLCGDPETSCGAAKVKATTLDEAGDEIQYEGGTVFIWKKEGRIKDRFQIACTNGGDVVTVRKNLP